MDYLVKIRSVQTPLNGQFSIGANTAPAVPNLDGSKVLEFKLTVTDDRGATAEDTVSITVKALNETPTANAGTDQQVIEGTAVHLSGRGTDPDGDTLTYSWAPAATLRDATTATPSFIAPAVAADTTLTFTLTVSDGHGGTATDSVNVLVLDNVVVLPTPTGKLNDTGITTCNNGIYFDYYGRPCPLSTHPGQDGDFGRDATANDDSDGHAGFSFTKISSTGQALPANAVEWSCVKDNVTGLIWEVRTNDSGLHDKDWTYTWYEPDNAKNGGDAGTQNGGICDSTSQCDTYGYVQAVNAAGWCGATDWRMPTLDELSGIVTLDPCPSPLIDTVYFPNTAGVSSADTVFWSSSSLARGSSSALYMRFADGYDGYDVKGRYYQVRLVRSGQ